jgi:hypothetical protein
MGFAASCFSYAKRKPTCSSAKACGIKEAGMIHDGARNIYPLVTRV